MQDQVTPRALDRRKRGLHIPDEGVWVGLGVLAFLAWLSVTQAHVLFHSFAEVIGATVAFLVSAIGWHTYPLTRNVFFLALGSGFFWVGVLTLLHALCFPGAGIVETDVPYLDIRLWLVLRLFEAVVLVTAIRCSGKSHVPPYMHVGFAVLFLGLLALVSQPWFPEVFDPETGLTSFKVTSEYLIIAVFMLALASMGRLQGRVDGIVTRRLSLAIGFMILSEFPFTLYRTVGDMQSVLGHIVTLVSYWFLLTAAVHTTLKQPLRVLSADAHIYEAFPDATVVVDREGKVRQANGAARREATVDNCLGESCHALFHPQALAEEDCPVCQHIRNMQQVRMLELEDIDTGRWYHISLLAIGDAGMIHVRRDVSELKRAECALRESELRYRALMTHATDAILVVGEGQKFVDANREAEQLFGYSRSELLHLGPADIHPCDKADALAHAFNHLRLHGSVLRELRFPLRDGSVKVKELAGARVELPTNVLFVGIFRDVTARRAAEDALRENEALLRQAEEIARMGSWDRNLVTGELRWSEGMYRILGDSAAKPSMQHLLEAIPECERNEVEAFITRAMDTGQEFRIDHRLHDAHGRERSIRMLGCAQCDEFGRPQRVFGTLMDITEAQRIAQELKLYREDLERLVTDRTAKLLQAVHELESFSYTVSHDLNAPLRAINGFSYALLDDCGEHLPAEGREYLERMISATNRMGQLIDGLLMLSRVIRRDLQLQTCDLSAVAREVFAQLRTGSGDRCVHFTVEAGITAEADPSLVRLLLENLIGNAWKFTRERDCAAIEFASHQDGGETVYLMRDNGIGFEMQFAETLFRPFHRLHGWDEYEGMGIGLATVQRIVSQHGGRIWAESRPGDGAVFYFTLSPRLVG